MLMTEIDLNVTQKHMLTRSLLLDLARVDIFDEWEDIKDFDVMITKNNDEIIIKYILEYDCGYDSQFYKNTVRYFEKAFNNIINCNLKKLYALHEMHNIVWRLTDSIAINNKLLKHTVIANEYNALSLEVNDCVKKVEEIRDYIFTNKTETDLININFVNEYKNKDFILKSFDGYFYDLKTINNKLVLVQKDVDFWRLDNVIKALFKKD